MSACCITAARKITLTLLQDSVASLVATGKKSNNFDHAPFLAQCLLTATKYFSCAEGYTFGKAAALRLMMQSPKYDKEVYFRFPRMNGSRFADSYSRTRTLVFMLQPLTDHLFATMDTAGDMSRIVSSLWSQLTSPVLMAEARVKEGIYNHILEPLQVMFGISVTPIACMAHTHCVRLTLIACANYHTPTVCATGDARHQARPQDGGRGWYG